jgi:hypothetical protein
MLSTAADTTLEQVDRRLDGLRAASERIGANLLELELDPTRRLLDGVSLDGSSAASWAAASARLLQLWQWHGLLDTHLDRAAKLRGTRTHLRRDQLSGLEELLDGESIAVEIEEVPLARRDLLGPSLRVVHLNADGLLTHMSSAFDEVKVVVASFADAWGIEPRLRTVAKLVADGSDLAARLDEIEPPELDRDRCRLTSLAQALRTDPLSVSAGEVGRIETSLRKTRADLHDLAEFRSNVDEHLRRAVELLGALANEHRECRAAHHEVSIKIAKPALREPVALGADVTGQVEQAAELAKAGAWSEARRALADWTVQATALLDETKSITRENRAPIGERNQLRGLLDAYRAKAVKHGLAEDPELCRSFARAQNVLFTAPTDLQQARMLVRACQRLLLGDRPGREAAS